MESIIRGFPQGVTPREPRGICRLVRLVIKIDRCLLPKGVRKTLGSTTLYIFGWGCVTGTLKPLPYTRPIPDLYQTLVLPYLDYCSEVWGCMGKSQCDRLQKLQNRAGRIITFSDYNKRSADILQDLGWDSLKQRCSKQLAISVFKSLHNLYPKGLKNMFKPTSRVHSHKVWGSSNNVFVPRPLTEAAKRVFSYRGLSCGMALVTNSKIRQISTLSSPL